MKRRVLKRLEEVNLSPEEGEALLERVETDTLSADDRQHVLEVLRAERDVLTLLEQPQAAPRRRAERQAKRKRQLAKASRRRNRRQ